MLVWDVCVPFFDYSDFSESFDVADSDDFSHRARTVHDGVAVRCSIVTVAMENRTQRWALFSEWL